MKFANILFVAARVPIELAVHWHVSHDPLRSIGWGGFEVAPRHRFPMFLLQVARWLAINVSRGTIALRWSTNLVDMASIAMFV